MNVIALQKLFQNLEPEKAEEAISIVLTGGEDPNAARSLWNLLLSINTIDERFQLALQWIIESVVIDQITNNINSDNEYALIIGERISLILNKLSQDKPEHSVISA